MALGITLDKLEALVRIQRRNDVEAFLGAKVPCAPRGWFSMDKHTTTNRAERGLVEIKWALEVLPSRDPRVERRLPEEVERELSLWKK